MQAKIVILSSAVAAYCLFSGVAMAGPLLTDSNSYFDGVTTWHGSTLFTDTQAGATLRAEVEYSVYAPGKFGTSAALGSPSAADPSTGTDFVYAYEIFNDRTGLNPSTTTVSNLSLGLLTGAIPFNSTRIGNDATTPELGIAPNLSQFIPSGNPKQAAKWSYTQTTLNIGQHSDILLFTSPFGPTTRQASMQGGDGATIPSAFLPTPVPEPTSLVVALIGAVCLLAKRYARRRAC